ncbi:PREDICTED: regulator of nonsense transcripts 2-like [Branchiostoma belcheri]|uniref:Regulator of nonsense transcripts 2 n=1 Tax=Branchiostoma belcheri TaxID=7741 RepID=A0A6P4ZV22_BRABE|nr:PREDICTED: regulator of nonsense transcripts 2-like [Branchiostoma belcheri]
MGDKAEGKSAPDTKLKSNAKSQDLPPAKDDGPKRDRDRRDRPPKEGGGGGRFRDRRKESKDELSDGRNSKTGGQGKDRVEKNGGGGNKRPQSARDRGSGEGRHGDRNRPRADSRGEVRSDHGKDAGKPRQEDRRSDRPDDRPKSSRDRDRNRRDRRDSDKTAAGKPTGKDDKKGKDSKREPKKTKEELKKEEEERKKRMEEERLLAEQKKAEEEQKRLEEEERRKEEEKKRQEEEQRRREEEEARRKEEEQKQAHEMAVEAEERIRAKKQLRTTNLHAGDNRPEEGFFSKLDSSLKKNTAFVKKLKTITEQQRESLTKEFNSLNLTKYIGEAVNSFVEAKLKMSDVSCAVHLCSLFHQRYAEFTPQLLQTWNKSFQARRDDKEEKKKEKGDKLRVDLRQVAELTVAGVFTDKEGLPLVASQLKALIDGDKEVHNNLTVLSSFCRHCGEDYAGLVPRKNRSLADKYNVILPKSEVFPSEIQGKCRQLLKDYFTSLVKHLQKDHKALQNQAWNNRRTLQTKGELSEDRQKSFEDAQAAYQKLLMNASTLADLLDEDMPDLPEDDFKEEEEGNVDIFLAIKGGEGEIGENTLWEDEETRSFYENLPNLKEFLPAILFKDSEKKSKEQEAEADTPEDTVEALEEEMSNLELAEAVEVAEAEAEAEAEGDTDSAQAEMSVEDIEKEILGTVEDVDEDTEGASGSSTKMLLEGFLQQLPNCVNREFIDNAGLEFCMNMNNKTNRRKLVRALFTVHRTRIDLLPFYSRLVATLQPCTPDVADDLVAMLKGDFRFHVRKKDQINLESKLKTVRFIGEMTKFGVFPKKETLHCLKMLLLDFRHHQIEMACALLESCGRFLYRSPDSHLRTKVLLEQMMRKKTVMHMNERYTTLIENAFYYCNPPEVERTPVKVRPPMHEYIRKLLYKDLSKITTEKVLRQMRKLNWQEEDTCRYAIKSLTRVWNVKYNNVHCVANMLAGLVPYQENVGILIVDGILEEIRLGMEINDPKYNQRRVSAAKYLGELYNYRLVESAVIFKTLYSFITFGVSLDSAVPSPLDPPEHMFRIRLVCVLLDTCGQYFDRGSSKRKLDCFLIYFQRYIWVKKSHPTWTEAHPFPIEVDFMVSDTVETLRPKLNLSTSQEEAVKAVEELEQEYRNKYSLPGQPEVQQPVTTQEGLTTIAEGEEGAEPTPQVDLSQHVGALSIQEVDDYEGSDQEEMAYEQDGSQSGSQTESQSQSQHHTGLDHADEAGEEGDYDDEEEEEEEEDEMLDSAGETEDDDEVTLLMGGPKLVKCAEDEDFMSAFDKMLAENIQHRSTETVKVPTLDIAIPQNMKVKAKAAPIEPKPESPTDTVNFVLMTRRGNKAQYHNLDIPVTSDLAINLRNREQEAVERERQDGPCRGLRGRSAQGTAPGHHQQQTALPKTRLTHHTTDARGTHQGPTAIQQRRGVHLWLAVFGFHWQG